MFEWIARFNQGIQEFEDQAEQRVLWDLEAMLESAVIEVLSPDYALRLEEARGRVRDRPD